MGYNLKLMSTILKSASMMSFKERWHARKAINALRKADDIVFKSFPKDVKEHNVTAALKEEAQAFNKLRDAAEAAESLIFEAEVVEDYLIDAINEVRDALRKKGIVHAEKRYLEAIVVALKHVDDEERASYKDVMAIITESEKGDKVLRASIMQRTKNLQQQSGLAKWAARSEVKTTLNDLKHIKKAARDIGHLKGTPEEIERNAASLLQITAHFVEEGFKESILIKKRGLFWIINILSNLYMLRDFGVKYVQMHYLPETPQKKQDEKLEKVVSKLNEEFRIIAQGYRIIINHIEAAEKELLK
jgi:hypothetical protein